jgi:hypothetical protein
MLASQYLANRQPGLVHEGQRLDKQQIEAVVAALGNGRCVARPAPTGPAGSIGQAVENHPADVVARLLVLGAGIPEANDDLHGCSSHCRRAWARHTKLALIRFRRACNDGIRAEARHRIQAGARIASRLPKVARRRISARLPPKRLQVPPAPHALPPIE